MQYKFSELINIKELESLMKSFYTMTGLSCLVRELEDSTAISVVGKFQYGNNYGFGILSEDEFRESIKCITERIKHRKKYVIHKCNSGVICISIPIIVNDICVAAIFTEQIFIEKPDAELIKDQARELKFYEKEYTKVIKNIPVIPKEKIRSIIDFLSGIGKLLGETGYTQLKELEVNKKLSGSYLELSSVHQQLHAAEQQLREQYDELERMAYYDALTNLPNYNFVQKKLNKYIDGNKLEKLGFIFVDLDNFKTINDTFGHQYGDKVLKRLGNELKLLLNKSCIVSRTSGDEFLILQQDIEEKEDVRKTIEFIQASLNKIWALEGKEFFISASIGAAIYPDDGSDYTEILRNTHIAMNKAKHFGKNSYVFFEKFMYDEVVRKTEMEKELRNVIKNNELILYYQPQVDVKTGKIVSLEALLRWNNKKFGWVPTVEFIKLAEETGLIVSIGEWVLENVCLQHKRWMESGYNYEFIAINVSVIQLQNSTFLDTVKRILEDTGMKPQYLEFEITESVMMQTLEYNLKVLNELRKMGIRIALDDFGTGYSSLNYLKCLPINTLKLDKSFIDGLCKSSYEEIITHEMIKLAHKMNLDVTAEGVELEEQLISLINKECNRIQGYYFSRPYPAENIEGILSKGIFNIYH